MGFTLNIYFIDIVFITVYAIITLIRSYPLYLSYENGGIDVTKPVRIIVISDSHGDYTALESIVERNLGKADIFIHLGDGERDSDRICLKYPHIDFRRVAGNCDYASMLPDSLVVDVDGARIFCAHGHRHFVKGGTETIRSVARDNDCNIVLFGHTHERYSATEDGMYVMNPGSCASPRDGQPPSFGSIEIR